MTSKASSLVAGAKQWASYYGDYANGDEGHVLTAILRIRAAWGSNDADAFADMFVDNGSMLVGDNQLMNREEIRAYMADAFSSYHQGTSLDEEPKEIKLLTDTSALAVTQGGVVAPGAAALADENEVRALWVLAKIDGDWRVVSHQTSPIKS